VVWEDAKRECAAADPREREPGSRQRWAPAPFRPDCPAAGRTRLEARPARRFSRPGKIARPGLLEGAGLRPDRLSDLAIWRTWIDYPLALPHGRGAVRAWLGFADGGLQADGRRLARRRQSAPGEKPAGARTGPLSGRIGGAIFGVGRAHRRPSRRTPDAAARSTGGPVQSIRIEPTDFHLEWQQPDAEAAIRCAAVPPPAQAGPRRTRRTSPPTCRSTPVAPVARRLCTARPHQRTARQLARQREAAGLLAAGRVRPIWRSARASSPASAGLSGSLEASEQGGAVQLRRSR
jgi:hypothetical protein